jgi:hypothetical protein
MKLPRLNEGLSYLRVATQKIVALTAKFGNNDK